MEIPTDDLSKFGKFLINHFQIPVNADDIDWSFIVSEYVKQTTHTTPGLIYINWIVSNYFRKDPVKVRVTQKRHKELIEPRQIGQYIAHKVFNYGYSDLKRFYHRKQHQTIISSIQRVEDLMFTDKAYNQKVNSIIHKLTNLEYEYSKIQIPRDGSEGSSRKVPIDT